MIHFLSLLEMASPTKNMKAITYYHGTENANVIKDIIANGIKTECGSGSRWTKFCKPLKRVYITKDLTMALGYALDSNVGSLNFEKIKEDANEEKIGYIVMIDGSELKDVYPDEDQIGFLCASRKNKKINSIFDKIANKEVPEELLLEENLISSHLTTYKEVLAHIKGKEDEYYSLMAHIGKLILKHLTAKDIIEILQVSPNIAHKGTLKAKEVYEITGESVKKMNSIEDFYEFAEQVE